MMGFGRYFTVHSQVRKIFYRHLSLLNLLKNLKLKNRLTNSDVIPQNKFLNPEFYGQK